MPKASDLRGSETCAPHDIAFRKRNHINPDIFSSAKCHLPSIHSSSNPNEVASYYVVTQLHGLFSFCVISKPKDANWNVFLRKLELPYKNKCFVLQGLHCLS